MRPLPKNSLFGLFLSLVILINGLPLVSNASAKENPVLPGTGSFCLVGQSWPGYDPDWIEPGSIHGGGESFYLLIDPQDGCDCQLGFDLTTVDFFLTYPDDSPLPITISVSMGLRQAISDPSGPISWLPGAMVCETPTRDFTMYISKLYVGFGIALECECVLIEAPYFLFFTVHSVMDPPGGFYTEGGKPELGRNLTYIDNQWVDLVAEGMLTRGNLVISGSARCCEPPVAVDSRTWNTIKAFFR